MRRGEHLIRLEKLRIRRSKQGAYRKLWHGDMVVSLLQEVVLLCNHTTGKSGKSLVALQVRGKNIDSAMGIPLYYDDRFMVGCEPSEDGSVVLSAATRASLLVAPQLKQPRLDPDDAFCLFEMKNLKPLKELDSESLRLVYFMKTIDWTTCGKNTIKCGVEGSCVSKPDEEFVFPTVTPINTNCKAGVWIRIRSDTIWEVKIQVLNKNIIPRGKISLFNNKKSVMGCVAPDLMMDVELSKTKLNAELSLKGSRIFENHAICEILVNDPSPLLSLVDDSWRLDYTMFPIDWTKCGTIAKCGVEGACVSQSEQLVFITKQPSINCDSGIYISFPNEKYKTIVKLRVRNKNIDPIFGIAIYRNDQYIIGCRAVNQLDAPPEWGAEITRRRDFLMSPNDAYCRIVVNKPKELISFPDDSLRLVYVKTVDWSTCENEAICGVQGDCVSMPSEAFVFPTSTPVARHCSAGLWMNPLSDTKWMVKLLVIGKDIDIIRGVSIFQEPVGERELFVLGCLKPDNGSLQAMGRPELGVVPIQIFNSRLDPSFAYCEILVNNAAPLLSLREGRFRLRYVMTSQSWTENFEAADTLGKMSQLRRCNPFLRQFKNETFGDGKIIKLEIKDFLSSKLQCSAVHPKSSLYAETRTLDKPRSTPIRVKRVECKHDGVDWVYEIEKEDGNKHYVPKDAEFEVFCGVNVKLMCIPPRKYAHPPTYSKDISTMEVSLKCPKNKWLINKEFYHNDIAFCHISKKYNNTAGWFVNREEKEVEINNAECTELLMCKLATTYNNTCLSDNGCTDLIMTDGIRCKVENTLRVIQLSGEKLENLEHLVCDEEKGKWTIEGRRNVLIDKGANIYCEKDPVISEAKSGTFSLVVSISLIIVVIIVVVVLIIRIFVKRD